MPSYSEKREFRILGDVERMNPFQEWHDYDVQVAAEENLAKGRIETYLDVVRHFVDQGMSAEEAAEHIGIPEDVRPAVLSALEDSGYTA